MTIKEAISDVKFKEFLDNQIHSCINKPLPPAGMKHRRTPFDGLKDMELMKSESILQEYVSIRERKSNLSSIQRDAVVYLVNMAMSDVVLYRKEESERKSKMMQYGRKRSKKNN